MLGATTEVRGGGAKQHKERANLKVTPLIWSSNSQDNEWNLKLPPNLNALDPKQRVIKRGGVKHFITVSQRGAGRGSRMCLICIMRYMNSPLLLYIYWRYNERETNSWTNFFFLVIWHGIAPVVSDPTFTTPNPQVKAATLSLYCAIYRFHLSVIREL